MFCLVLFLGLKFGEKKVYYKEVEILSVEVPIKVASAMVVQEYLPPIPVPTNNGRIAWGAYWSDMTPNEKRVYGSYVRKDEPKRVGLQVGHWKISEAPNELKALRENSGAKGGGMSEYEAMLKIALEAKDLLEAKGIIVDLLPATVPVDYVADAFIAIHADGNSSTKPSGFKLATPERDFSGKADILMESLYDAYGKNTGLSRDDNNITKRMTSYYAFNWRRYDHAVHPMTPSVILETGFMTNASDRKVILDKPHLAAKGIAEGVLKFLGV